MITRFEEADRGDLKDMFKLITFRELNSRELDWMLEWVDGMTGLAVPVARVITWLKERPIREHISLAEKLQLEALDGRKIHYDPF